VIGSLRIGSIFGIQVRLHWLFVLMVVYLVAALGNPLASFVCLTVLFGVVLLHELGHSLVAQRFGIRVLDITLWPLGGMARMSAIPENSRVEGLVAIAGPAVNFALALLALPFASWNPDQLLAPIWAPVATFGDVAAKFVVLNLGLGVFNLLPAFPMDGGRILRAFLARKRDWLRATELAVATGRWIAAAMVLYGLFGPEGRIWTLPLIGVFVWFVGTRELWAVRMRHQRQRVERAMGSAPPDAELGRSTPDLAAQPAVVDASGARRPATAWQPAAGSAGNSGLSAEDIERLERFRGSIRGR
jgi:Zn-dependent protease